MAQYIAPENLQKCYGGHDSWEYEYIAPVEGENEQEEEKKEKPQAERDELIQKFEDLSAEWVKLDPESAAERQKMTERDEVARRLSESFWKLDPYVRARTYYHRAGVIGPSGQVDYNAAK
jgi:hypothetical protein